MHGHCGQVGHLLPVLTAVEGDVKPALCARIQQVRVARVFAHGEHIALVAQPIRNLLPGLAAVGGFVDVGAIVAKHVAVEGNIRDIHIRAGRLHMRNGRVGRQVRHIADEVRPRGAAIPGHLQVAVVRAHPDDPGLNRRLGEADNRAVELGGGVLHPHGTARVFLLFGVVGGEVGADDAPSGAKVSGFEHHLCAHIDRVGVMRRQHNRRVPVESVFEVFDGTAVATARLRADVFLNARVHIGANNIATLRLADNPVGLFGVEHTVEAVAEADHAPVFVHDHAVLGAGVADPAAVILQTACDLVEGRLVADHHLIELPQRDVANHIPCGAPIHRERQPAVVTVPHPVGVGGVNPERMVVGMHARGDLFTGAPAVDGHAQLGCQEVEPVLVFGVYAHVGVVETARDDVGFPRDEAESFALIVGAKQRAVVRFGNHIDHIRVAGRDFDADAPHQFW
ncbi:hypothetical protein HRbin14_01449 [bacterium HR14]|nr:hypothetical protein HRbin14_01449 [bacterium HR14]